MKHRTRFLRLAPLWQIAAASLAALRGMRLPNPAVPRAIDAIIPTTNRKF